MSSLKDPVCIFGVSNDSIIPFDDKMTRSSFEQGWARKVVHIQLRFGRHIDMSSEIFSMTYYRRESFGGCACICMLKASGRAENDSTAANFKAWQLTR